MYKNILVTGSSGFIGSHVADELTTRGYRVHLVDKRSSPYRQDSQKEHVGDLQDEIFLLEITKGIDCVYHFAGIADIGECAKNSRQVVINNILSTVNLLEACRLNHVKKVILASTAYVFSNNGGFYRTSKRACESFLCDYHRIYGLDYAILRYGSLYGPRANIKNGVYRLCKGLLDADGAYLHEGAGDEMREFVNVVDAARLSVDVIEKNYPSKIFMITGLDRYKMSELIQMVQEIIGKKVPVQYSETLGGHYKITPYSYQVDESVKLVNNPYCDMGQGIINVIREIKANG